MMRSALPRCTAASACCGNGRSLVHALQVVGVAPHVIEGAHRAVGKLEGRNAGLVQDLLAGRNLRAAHPTRQHRLAQPLGVRLQLLGDLGWIGHVLRRQDHQHAVDAGIFGGNLQRLRVAFGLGIAQDVHRIVVAPLRRAGSRRRPSSFPPKARPARRRRRPGHRWPARPARRRWSGCKAGCREDAAAWPARPT